MERIKYKIENGLCVILCPHNRKDDFNTAIHVGSGACACCKSCKLYDNESKTVVCSFKDENKLNKK